MKIILLTCLLTSTTLLSAEIILERDSNNKCIIEHHLTDHKAISIHHKKQNPEKFPGRGNKQNQRKNGRD